MDKLKRGVAPDFTIIDICVEVSELTSRWSETGFQRLLFQEVIHLNQEIITVVFYKPSILSSLCCSSCSVLFGL